MPLLLRKLFLASPMDRESARLWIEHAYVLDKQKNWNVYWRIELHVYLNKKETKDPILTSLLDSCLTHPYPPGGVQLPSAKSSLSLWGGLAGGFGDSQSAIPAKWFQSKQQYKTYFLYLFLLVVMTVTNKMSTYKNPQCKWFEELTYGTTCGTRDSSNGNQSGYTKAEECEKANGSQPHRSHCGLSRVSIC
jgi:hypothetical protein